MDKQLPAWVRYALIFAGMVYLTTATASIVNLPVIIGILAVMLYRVMEGTGSDRHR